MKLYSSRTDLAKFLWLSYTTHCMHQQIYNISEELCVRFAPFRFFIVWQWWILLTSLRLTLRVMGQLDPNHINAPSPMKLLQIIWVNEPDHYIDVIMTTSVSNHQPHDFFSTSYSDADQRKHQSSASLAFVRGIHRGPVNSPQKTASNAENVSIWWRHHAIL